VIMAALTDAERATLEARLAEAETALHMLMTGRQAVMVRTDTETVQYSLSDTARLSAYVRSLRAQLGRLPRGGAIGVAFR